LELGKINRVSEDKLSVLISNGVEWDREAALPKIGIGVSDRAESDPA